MKDQRSLAPRIAWPPRLRAVSLVVALLAAACGSPASPARPASPAGASPSPTLATAAPLTDPPASGSVPVTPVPVASPAPPDADPTPVATAADPLAIYETIEDQVIALRGLPASGRLQPVVLTEDQLRTEMERQFAAEVTPEMIAEADALMTALGLIEPGASLEKLYLDLMVGQVAGFYDFRARTISVVTRSGQIGAVEKTIFAHEFNHALQDQRFNITAMREAVKDDGDRSIAVLAVIEGDATWLMGQWAINLAPAEILELLNPDPAAAEALEKAPAFLRDSLTFPYEQGMAFVAAAWSAGGWDAVNDLYNALPASTEQLIHPDKYRAGEQPVAVTIDAAAAAAALGSGWTAAPLDTFGEFQVRAWLAARLSGDEAAETATTAAAGWGGDRLLVLRGPDGAFALMLSTAWDTVTDAEEFAGAAQSAIAGLPAAQLVRLAKGIPDDPEPARWAVLVGSSPDVLQTLRDAVALPVP